MKFLITFREVISAYEDKSSHNDENSEKCNQICGAFFHRRIHSYVQWFISHKCIYEKSALDTFMTRF